MIRASAHEMRFVGRMQIRTGQVLARLEAPDLEAAQEELDARAADAAAARNRSQMGLMTLTAPVGGRIDSLSVS
jgi:multidrug resistance efflux pump